MNYLEKRKAAIRMRPHGKVTCFLKVQLQIHVYVIVRAEVLDMSAYGMRLRIAFKPDIHDVLMLTENLCVDYPDLSSVSVVVRWCRQNITETYVCEIGCEVNNSEQNLKRFNRNWNVN